MKTFSRLKENCYGYFQAKKYRPGMLPGSNIDVAIFNIYSFHGVTPAGCPASEPP